MSWPPLKTGLESDESLEEASNVKLVTGGAESMTEDELIEKMRQEAKKMPVVLDDPEPVFKRMDPPMDADEVQQYILAQIENNAVAAHEHLLRSLRFLKIIERDSRHNKAVRSLVEYLEHVSSLIEMRT